MQNFAHCTPAIRSPHDQSRRRPDGYPFAPLTEKRAGWVRRTITVQGGAISCGPHGDGADDGTNSHKNRADVPVAPHAVTLDAIRALPDTALWRWTNRQHWTAADSGLVLPYEGIPVTVEGYLEIVKPQSGQAPAPGKTVGESPNCHSWAERDTDWHMALVADPSEPEERAVVVEPTPRIRGHCTGSCTATSFYRATLWEVHPVTRIEVLRNGSWVELGASP